MTTLGTQGELIGRDDELAVLADLFSRRDELPFAAVLEGEAGIGKTALWVAGVEVAAAASFTVLAARPSESETKIAYSVLRDLLGPSFAELSPELPAPQRRALEVALLLSDAAGNAPDRGVIGVATLSALGELASGLPVVVALDDAQWIDAASASALLFAVRRLDQLPVALLLTTRSADAETELPALATALPAERVHHERLRPLSLGALHTLIRLRLGMTFPRPALFRLHQISGGNPFFALELARALERRGGVKEYDQDLPVPRLLRALIEERLVALPVGTREVLVYAAGLAQPSVPLLDAALDDDAEARLRPAVQAQVIELEGDRIVFTHPLLASVLVSVLTARERRSVHGRLAEVVPDPEERGRHLSLATERPDADVAEALDRAAGLAKLRGAPDAAAELLEHARRLTPADRPDDRRRRAVGAAEFYLEAGETDRAIKLLEEAVGVSPPGRVRAEALLRLAWVRGYKDGFGAVDLLVEALAEAEGDVRTLAEIEDALAWARHMSGDLVAAARHARSALDLAEGLGEASILARALANIGLLDFLRGSGVDRAALDRALALEAKSADLRIMGQPSWLLAMLQVWTGEVDSARSTLNELHRRAAKAGDENAGPFILNYLSRLAWSEGDYTRADQYVDDAIAAALRNAQEPEQAFVLATKALVSAHRGRVDAANEVISEGLSLAIETGMRPAEFEFRAISGFLALSLGDCASADAHLAPLRRDLAAGGFREPAVIALRFHADAIEALVGLGRLDEAEELVEELEERGRRLDRAWALATGARCRALLCSARGDLKGALPAFEDAIRAHEQLSEPFELGRTLLLRGTVQRRLRQSRAARESLAAALDQFEAVGAPLWADRVKAELARIGGRAVSSSALTPAEARVAALVAAGRTNKEVAAELFISVHTVEAALTRVYSKLGVRSRSELARQLAGVGGGGKV